MAEKEKQSEEPSSGNTRKMASAPGHQITQESEGVKASASERDNTQDSADEKLSASESENTQELGGIEPSALESEITLESADESYFALQDEAIQESARVAPSAPPLELLEESTGVEPSAPPLEMFSSTAFEMTPEWYFADSSELLFEDPQKSPDGTQRQKKSRSAMMKALKLEEAKYEGLNFDLPPAEWSKEDKQKMREIMRSMSIGYKKKANKERAKEIDKQTRLSGPVETELAREIIGLLQKDNNLMNHMELKHVAFSTFSRTTYDWNKVAELLDHNHTPAECKEYWYMDLYPRVKNMGFSAANDKQLIDLAIKHNYRNWDQIANKLIGHTEYQCFVHFRRYLSKKLHRID